MKNIRWGQRLARAGLCAVVFASAAAAAVSVQAQEAALKYKIIEGQVYAYEPDSPANMYLVPNLTPEQVGLGGEVEAQAREAAMRNQNQPAAYGLAVNPYASNGAIYGNPNAFVYGNPPGYGYPSMAPPGPAAANNALPALTFQLPLFSPQYLPNLGNPIGGLPRYPGQNYYPGYAAPTPW